MSDSESDAPTGSDVMAELLRHLGLGPRQCRDCGACCVFSSTWPEFEEDPDGDGIPLELVDCETGRMKCDGDRCLALEGVVGREVRCKVYAHRPKVCREFSPWTRTHDCNTVRAYSGLPPLTNNSSTGQEPA